MKNLVLFASGSKTNVENIIRYSQNNSSVQVTQAFTYNKDAKVIGRINLFNHKALRVN